MEARRSQSRMSALEAQNVISALMCEDQPDSDVELFGDENSDYDTDVSDVDSDILNSQSETPVQVAAGASKIQDFSVADLMSESDSDSNQTSSQVAVSSAASVTQGGFTADISFSDSASDNQATAPGRPTQNPLLDSWKQISQADSDTRLSLMKQPNPAKSLFSKENNLDVQPIHLC